MTLTVIPWSQDKHDARLNNDTFFRLAHQQAKHGPYATRNIVAWLDDIRPGGDRHRISPYVG